MNKLPDTELFPKECKQLHLFYGVLYYYDEHGQVVLIQEERRNNDG